MNLTIFISYDTKDTDLINALYSYLRQNGINVNTSQSFNPSFKRSIQIQIKSLIRESDCVLAIFTLSDKNRSAIDNEMKMAINSGKLVIPIIEKGVYPDLDPAHRYIIYDRNNPWETIQSVRIYSEWLETSRYRDSIAGKLCMGLVYLFLALSFFDTLPKKDVKRGKENGFLA